MESMDWEDVYIGNEFIRKEYVARFFGVHRKENVKLFEAAEQNAKDLEQARVQLAGCSVAAKGGTANPAHRGDYGWSVAYGDVLRLRLWAEQMKAAIEAHKTWAGVSIWNHGEISTHRVMQAALDACEPLVVKKTLDAPTSVNGSVRQDLLDAGEPAKMKGEPSTCNVCGCNVCGSALVSIRGRYPGEDNREVCPTCAVEKLEYLRGYLADNTGKSNPLLDQVQ